jgi:hypothetical protein
MTASLSSLQGDIDILWTAVPARGGNRKTSRGFGADRSTYDACCLACCLSYHPSSSPLTYSLVAFVPLYQDIWLLYTGGSVWALEHVDFDVRAKDGCAASVASGAVTQSPSAGCGRVDIRVILLAMFPFVR